MIQHCGQNTDVINFLLSQALTNKHDDLFNTNLCMYIQIY